MSEVVVQPGSEGGTPPSAPDQTAAGTPAAAPAVPAGYVPVTELEKEQARARGFQSEAGRLKTELEKLQPPTPAPTKADGTPDIAAQIEQSMSDALGKVFRAGEVRDAATALKAEFPKVAEFDPTIFSGDRLAGYESADSLRSYVEDVNARLTKILGAGAESESQEAREALAAQAAGSQGPVGATPPPAGDPSLEQLGAMTLAQIDALELANPGTVDRVMAKARAAS